MLDQTHCYTQEKFGRARETLDVGEKAPKAKGFDVHNKKNPLEIWWSIFVYWLI